MLLGARGTGTPTDITTGFRKALLTAHSESPDNLACVEHLEYGSVPGPPYAPERGGAGLKITGTDILISDVASRKEDSPVPTSVAEAFPELSPEQWSAVTRVITLLLGALEAPCPMDGTPTAMGAPAPAKVEDLSEMRDE